MCDVNLHEKTRMTSGIMTPLASLLFVLAGFVVLYFPRPFLRKWKGLSSSELRNLRKATELQRYPWIQLGYAVVSGAACFIVGLLLWPSCGTKVYALFGAWVALLGVFDGWFAAWTGVYPIPERIGYFYVTGNDEYIGKLGKIHICVAVAIAVLITTWVMFS
jgi:hypothetical protein